MLNKKDQKIIRQMMRHIRTFPLLDSEIRQFERDLTGMALEAEKRREDFEEILDMKRNFVMNCSALLAAEKLQVDVVC